MAAKTNSLLEQLAGSLDISPSDFKKASDRFTAVSNWLSQGNYSTGSSPSIYLQGSFRLGTTIKPYREGKELDYDIDQVIELTRINANPTAKNLKNDIKIRLEQNTTYQRLLDREGRRCWTLVYASDAAAPGFHIDILPSATSNSSSKKISITTKNKDSTYAWSSSNPNGYYYWFKGKNPIEQKSANETRRQIYEQNKTVFGSSEHSVAWDIHFLDVYFPAPLPDDRRSLRKPRNFS